VAGQQAACGVAGCSSGTTEPRLSRLAQRPLGQQCSDPRIFDGLQVATPGDKRSGLRR